MQGILAPVQFVVFLISLGLVLRYLATGAGYEAATWSIVIKTGVLYLIMVTGSLWEHAVFGKYLLADAFYWEDVVSFLVLALHTLYLAALFFGWASPGHAHADRAGGLCQLCRQCCPVPGEAAHGAPRGRWHRSGTRRAGSGIMTGLAPMPLTVTGCDTRPVLRERGQHEVFCGLTGIMCFTARSRTPSS